MLSGMRGAGVTAMNRVERRLRKWFESLDVCSKEGCDICVDCFEDIIKIVNEEFQKDSSTEHTKIEEEKQ